MTTLSLLKRLANSAGKQNQSIGDASSGHQVRQTPTININSFLHHTQIRNDRLVHIHTIRTPHGICPNVLHNPRSPSLYRKQFYRSTTLVVPR